MPVVLAAAGATSALSSVPNLKWTTWMPLRVGTGITPPTSTHGLCRPGGALAGRATTWHVSSTCVQLIFNFKFLCFIYQVGCSASPESIIAWWHFVLLAVQITLIILWHQDSAVQTFDPLLACGRPGGLALAEMICRLPQVRTSPSMQTPTTQHPVTGSEKCIIASSATWCQLPTSPWLTRFIAKTAQVNHCLKWLIYVAAFKSRIMIVTLPVATT